MKHSLRYSLALLCSFFTQSILAQTAGPALNSGLVTWLQLDEATGSKALDASGSGKSGLVTTGAIWSPVSATAPTGKLRGAIYLTNGTAVQIPLQWQPAAFSISWRVNGNSRSEWNQAIGASLNFGDAWSGFLFHTSSSGKVYAGTDLATRIESADNEFQTGVWQHFVFTFNRGEAALYKDGRRIAYRSSGMSMPAAWRGFAIGSTTNTELRANGYYDDLRIYDRVITTSEIAQLKTTPVFAYTPPTAPSEDLDRNWSSSRSFDGNGNIIGESKSFSDGLGRPTQAQVKSQTSGHVLATQTIYSSGGKPAVSTLAAPTDNTAFRYKSQFITVGGTDYGPSNFEGSKASNPDVPDYTGVGTLRYYYSSQNTLEPLTPATAYPFSITEEYGGPLGGVKRAAGPGEAFRMGAGHEAKGREFPLLNELDHYLSFRSKFIKGPSLATTLRLKGEKAVSVNADGKESISFSDADGKLLATCLSGSQYPGLTLSAAIHSVRDNADGIPQYQDLHVPAAGPVTLSVQGTGRIRIVNLLTETISSYSYPWSTITLEPGFYRVISDQDNQIVRYLARYGEFSYSYYDDAGRMVATVAPKGVGDVTDQSASMAATGAGRAGHWSFNESGGTTTSDESGNKVMGTLINQPTWSHQNASPAGGASLLFDGQNDYVTMGDASALRLSTNFTIEAWIYPTRNVDGIIVNKEDEYEIGRFSDGSIQWAFWNTNPGWNWVNTGIIAPLNKWSHIGITYENGKVTAYLNGVQVGTPYSGSGPIQYHGGEFRIGSRYCCGQYFQGGIDEVRIWNTVRPPSPGPAEPLNYVTRNIYSGAGTLLATQSTDEGRTEYVYARDGRIRFSQSALQKQQNRFSYSNYDEVGQVVESGEYQMTSDQGHLFENQLLFSTLLEAEAAQTNSGINQVMANASGGSVGYLTEVGRYVTFTVTVPRTGSYSLDLQYAAGSSPQQAPLTMSLYMDGTKLQQGSFPGTGAWTNWASRSFPVSLSAGSHTVMVRLDQGDSGYIDLDYLQVGEIQRIPAANSVLHLLEERMPTNSLDSARCSQRNLVWYDLPTQDSQLNGRSQEFVLGAVAKTSNGTNTTWYSYDELGRVMWMVQKAPGVGVKTVDYTYDFTGDLLEVTYQKGQPDAFYHHYEYDADKRLRSVSTSPDGVAANRTLHARYFYYLHGPLKRVEIADRLQGIDYAYTVQGWLKSINNSEKQLDPGQDSPLANGTLKDLFGMRLDYFDGDYRSRQLTAPSLTGAGLPSVAHYDGTVKANSWHTAAAPTVHSYAYQYDEKGQLLQSDYGTLTGGNLFTRDNAQRFEEGNLSYDTHGNILSLRRRDGAGLATDDFTYQYTANTNKLQAVKNQNGANVLSYDYDVNGQMTRESESGKTDKHLRYDVTGKVTGVYRNADFTGPVATYTYNDRGFRSSKVVYSASGSAQNTTHYVLDAQGNILSTYEQPAGQALQQTEVPLYGSGRVGTLTRLDDGTLDARYELNDQLGNARVIFHKPKTTKLQAFMEPGQATEEEKTFANIASTRISRPYAYSGTYLSRINPGEGITEGPALAKPLAVEKGDTLTFSAYTLAFPPARPAPGNLKPLLLSGVAVMGSSTALPPMEREGRSFTRNSKLRQVAAGVAFTGFTKATQQRTTALTAGLTTLRYIFRDTDGAIVEDRTVSVSGATGAWQQLRTGVRASKAGTVEVMLISTMPQEVFFDNVEIEQTGSAIVQEQHQYAFGSPLTGLNYVVGNKRYRHGYQGQYAERDEETGYDSFELRLYNSRIGRWMSYDPEGQFNSPYVGMGNNPVSSVDPDGGWSGPNGPGWATGGTRFTGLASKFSGTGVSLFAQGGMSLARTQGVGAAGPGPKKPTPKGESVTQKIFHGLLAWAAVEFETRRQLLEAAGDLLDLLTPDPTLGCGCPSTEGSLPPGYYPPPASSKPLLQMTGKTGALDRTLGEKILGWGKSASPDDVAKTLNATKNMTRESAKEMIKKGATRDWAKKMHKIYDELIKKENPAKLKNPQLVPRRDLMKKFLDLTE